MNPPSTIARTSSPEVVCARLSRLELVAILVIGVATPVAELVGVSLFLAPKDPYYWTQDIWIGIGLSSLLTVFIALTIGATHVKALRFGPSELTVETWFSKSHVPYTEIRPTYIGPPFFPFGLRWIRPDGHFSGPCGLSLDQGRALLTHPQVPRRLFPAETWKRVGLQPPESTEYLLQSASQT
jgi:hypothetical protein